MYTVFSLGRTPYVCDCEPRVPLNLQNFEKKLVFVLRKLNLFLYLTENWINSSFSNHLELQRKTPQKIKLEKVDLYFSLDHTSFGQRPLSMIVVQDKIRA